MNRGTTGPAGPLNALLNRAAVRTIMTLLDADGGHVRIVGGAIRNTLLGLPVSDIDFATSLAPDLTMARATAAGLKVVPTGIAHGTVSIVIDGVAHEVTTLRRDVKTDGRRAVVAFSNSFEDDATRRDLTINQLSLSADGELHDYAGGLADLAARRVRFIGDPSQRITEDYLRIMRFFRFHAEYAEGEMDRDGLAAATALRAGMAQLSAERIRAELLKLLVARKAGAVMPHLVQSGVWHEAVGDIEADVAAYRAAVPLAPQSDAMARLAALAVRDTGHAAALADRLRLSGAERGRLEGAAKALAMLQSAELSDQAYRWAGLQHGEAAVRDALAILCVRLGLDRARELAALAIPASPFKGADVLALGVATGPEVGLVLGRANEAWADLGFPDDRARQAECLRKAVGA